ncbi:DNA-binding transcriptional regulator, LysR family [Nocardioides terrae]|uniref:DNA-binding transcriptional regulator, LysR family n=1 Tax=Nocardioides terrae TaxID=574651 RepID=A0A1I1DB83_9ACTN|nr:LysR family transcriptional regulator [Nocardioides terrae]SFB71622.1 DNA-binding transcriptional regulator, LysR family [Nocardioides terrae]
MLDVRRLRLLREVHIRGTIAAVAAALHQSPSSVSQQLSQLEREVGVELLRKVGRGVQLTPEAELLVGHADALFERLELAESDLLAAADEASGTVRMGMFQSAALALLPTTLRLVQERVPRIRVFVVQREPETALRETFARDFDLVVAEQYPGHAAPWHPQLDRQPLTEDAIRLAAGAPDVGSLADAAQLPWVMEPRGAASRHFAEQLCRRAGFEPDVRFETADLQAHVALVSSGHAVALLPDLLWRGGVPPVRLVDLPEAAVRSVFTASPLSLASRPAVRAVRAALVDAVGSMDQTVRPDSV